MPSLIPTATNGTTVDGHAIPDGVQSTKMNGVAKSRNQLRRMKNKAKKQKASVSGAETDNESVAGSSYYESEAEVSCR
jgi:hypothetical protein